MEEGHEVSLDFLVDLRVSRAALRGLTIVPLDFQKIFGRHIWLEFLLDKEPEFTWLDHLGGCGW